jgi:hypothetical protein
LRALKEMEIKGHIVSNDKQEGQLTTEHDKAYEEDNTLFVGAVIGALADHIQDVYLRNKTGKALWNALNNNYGGSDGGTKLYIIEQYHNYKMIDGKDMVEQAHEIVMMTITNSDMTTLVTFNSKVK